MKKLVLAIVVMACMVGVVHAEQPALMQGGWELGLDGGFDFEDMHGTALAVDVSIGYFIKDNIEIGGILGYAFAEGDPDNDTVVVVGAFAEYNFDLGNNWVPYVGAELGYALYDAAGIDENVFQVAGSVGVKYFMTENWAIAGEIVFVWASEDIFNNGGTIEDTDLGANLGIRTYF